MNHHLASLGVTAGRDADLLGIGLYSVVEAARLVQTPSRRLRRWLLGYGRIGDDGVRQYPGLWLSDVMLEDGSRFLSFRDLMEMRVSIRFANAGVRLETLRKCHASACEVLGTDRPFSDKRFRTDGRTIFLEDADVQDDSALLDLLNGQWAFRRLVAPTFADVEHAEGKPVRWWALNRNRSVVIDPTRAFGQPIAARSGVPTNILAEAVVVEGSVSKVAHLYEVEVNEVRDAVAFEERMAA